MENSLKGLILAAGTIITCVVISLGFFISREAKDTASNGANQINKLNAEFIPISKRTIHDIQVELSGSLSYNEIMRKIDESVADIPQSDIVQITLSGEVTEETEIEPDSYVSTIENNFFYVRIKDKTELKIDYEKYKNDISLKGEFIRLVNQNNDLSDEEKAKVIMTGIKALAGRLN